MTIRADNPRLYSDPLITQQWLEQQYASEAAQ